MNIHNIDKYSNGEVVFDVITFVPCSHDVIVEATTPREEEEIF